MNYEELYQSLQPQEKALKDKITSLQKACKTIIQETEKGDIKSLLRDLDSIAETARLLSENISQIQNEVSGFDTAAYFEQGDFARQMLEACENQSVDVIGDFPVYEMFPYRVKLDIENQDIYLDRKKVQCMRPASFVEQVKKGQERLNKAAFNALTFAGELADAYDLAIMKLGKSAGYDVYLTSLYKYLAPMSRYRKDYDQQSFAFDLARLYSSGILETKNGRSLQFGPSRKQSKSIRVLDRNGQEQYLSTICFYDKQETSLEPDTQEEMR